MANSGAATRWLAALVPCSSLLFFLRLCNLWRFSPEDYYEGGKDAHGVLSSESPEKR